MPSSKALEMADATRRARNTTKRICAIPEAAPASLPKPRIPAMMASMRKVGTQANMILFLSMLLEFSLIRAEATSLCG